MRASVNEWNNLLMLCYHTKVNESKSVLHSAFQSYPFTHWTLHFPSPNPISNIINTNSICIV